MENIEAVWEYTYNGGSDVWAAAETSNSDASITLPPILLHGPESPDEARLSQLIEEARSLRQHGKLYRIALGRVLLAIHAIKAKPGCGNFMKTVKEEIGMPYTTARDYMQEAEEEDRYEARKVVKPTSLTLASDVEVADYDPNNGAPDAVAAAIKEHQQGLLAARAATHDPTRVREFNWKFKNISLEYAEALKEAKAKLGSERAARLLLEAANSSLLEEVLDVGIAA